MGFCSLKTDIRKSPHRTGPWNVRTLFGTGKLANVTKEMGKNNLRGSLLNINVLQIYALIANKSQSEIDKFFNTSTKLSNTSKTGHLFIFGHLSAKIQGKHGDIVEEYGLRDRLLIFRCKSCKRECDGKVKKKCDDISDQQPDETIPCSTGQKTLKETEQDPCFRGPCKGMCPRQACGPSPCRKRKNPCDDCDCAVR
ncbi:hypothetical protein HHI36_000885 [Cryptolaemus montrouzieri]|uniref:Uncharacterized protein n=1 Tax=Cryptolaemus montrouzieri TaxID=559131 RepID=A0ABD2P615_9CUCU